jgi:hypothetical protein
VICPRHKLAYETLACSACVAEHAQRGLADLTATLLGVVVAGRADLPTGMLGVTRHIGLVTDPFRSFCGVRLTQKLRRPGVALKDVRSATLCMKCQDRLAVALADLPVVTNG